MIDNTTEFMKGAILGYCQTHKPEKIGEIFDDAFKYLNIREAKYICLSITASFFEHYDKEKIKNE